MSSGFVASENQVKIIHGAHILNLSSYCNPKANTESLGHIA